MTDLTKAVLKFLNACINRGGILYPRKMFRAFGAKDSSSFRMANSMGFSKNWYYSVVELDRNKFLKYCREHGVQEMHLIEEKLDKFLGLSPEQKKLNYYAMKMLD